MPASTEATAAGRHAVAPKRVRVHAPRVRCQHGGGTIRRAIPPAIPARQAVAELLLVLMERPPRGRPGALRGGAKHPAGASGFTWQRRLGGASRPFEPRPR